MISTSEEVEAAVKPIFNDSAIGLPLPARAARASAHISVRD
jgi:hypothetical protein